MDHCGNSENHAGHHFGDYTRPDGLHAQYWCDGYIEDSE